MKNRHIKKYEMDDLKYVVLLTDKEGKLFATAATLTYSTAEKIANLYQSAEIRDLENE